MDKADVLILGYGYVAQTLEQELLKKDSNIQLVKTSRQKQEGFLYFDLEDPESWDQLPQASLTYWTFPPAEENIKNFSRVLKKKSDKTIVIGTTGSFATTAEHQVISESSPFDEAKQRARSEEFLLSFGFTLVMSAGIYGPGRNPLDWVQSGRVGKSEKYVNMIHVSDLVQFLMESSKKTEGSLYIASDGNPQTWQNIIEYWEKKGLVNAVPQKESSRPSKKLDPQKSIKDLNLDLQFRNFQEAVFSMNQPS
jgi:nucleoside-diphosphate-sugar epimerase